MIVFGRCSEKGRFSPKIAYKLKWNVRSWHATHIFQFFHINLLTHAFSILLKCIQRKCRQNELWLWALSIITRILITYHIHLLLFRYFSFHFICRKAKVPLWYLPAINMWNGWSVFYIGRSAKKWNHLFIQVMYDISSNRWNMHIPHLVFFFLISHISESYDVVHSINTHLFNPSFSTANCLLLHFRAHFSYKLEQFIFGNHYLFDCAHHLPGDIKANRKSFGWRFNWMVIE